MPRIAALAAAAWVATAFGCASLHPALTTDPPVIWDVRGERYVTVQELTDRLEHARFRLLGEIHDNPAHHALRAQVLHALAARQRHPAVVFEQFDADHDRALVDAQRAGVDAEGLASAGALDRAGWEWPLHKPLLEAALQAHLPVHAGNISRLQLDAVARTNDLSPIDARLRSLIADAPWNARKERMLEEEIVQGHCGKLPASVVPRIALAQRVRDAALAAALVEDATPDGAVLIAGNGHVRQDLGVPIYLGAAARDAISVGWIEMSPDEMRARDAARIAAAEHPGFDYLWLTDAVHRPDPCATIPDIKDERTKGS